MIKVTDFEMGSFPDYLGGPNIITQILKSREFFPAEVRPRNVLRGKNPRDSRVEKDSACCCQLSKRRNKPDKQGKARKQLLALVSR